MGKWVETSARERTIDIEIFALLLCEMVQRSVCSTWVCRMVAVDERLSWNCLSNGNGTIIPYYLVVVYDAEMHHCTTYPEPDNEQ